MGIGFVGRLEGHLVRFCMSSESVISLKLLQEEDDETNMQI